MENKVLKRIIIFVTVFMLVFSNCGYTLQALAATDGFTLFGFNLFGSGNIDFDVYFLDENGKKQTEKTGNVKDQMTMVLEFTPKAEGYLKSGTIKAVSEGEGNINFKFDEAIVDKDEAQELTVATPADTSLLQSEMTLDLDKIELNLDDITTNETGKNEVAVENTVETSNTVSSENTTIDQNAANIVEENVVVPANTVTEENVVEEETVVNSPEEENSEEIIEDEFVDEETALNEQNETETLISSNLEKATVVSDDEIQIENIIENTKVYVNISFKTGENLNIEDLYKQIRLEFEAKYINTDLEELPISLSEEVSIGWEYTKDVDVSSEYTKVSPFRVGETKGTIVENTISIKRDITDENYLPLKDAKISINVPELKGNSPIEFAVKALKLKATTGEDVNEVTFTDENWEYDSNNNTLNITVENKDGKFTYGEDIYVVTYRYDTYIEESEISLETEGTVTITEYSGKDNNVIVKDLKRNQTIPANQGELITYSISTNEDKIGKGKINANYNGSEEIYESEFSTTVSVNILTNDVLNEFTLKDTKEFYIDKENLEFETNDVKYKKVKFTYEEIRDFLENGGNIEIKSNNGELLYNLNKDLVKSDADAEITIQGDVRGIEISFKNITTNGNVNIEFTKAIGKSNYEKAAFTNFKKLESRISARVRYAEDAEETELSEIRIQKEFEESKTEAEVMMNKVSLSTAEVNENVEFKIELNNDRENSDLYVNPVFEISLPKYVTKIDIKAANILYAVGLSIGNTTIYRAEDGTQRIRIEVNGTQKEFSKGEITNGTNIIINTNIELDKYSPRKDEQVKLYYINEGVTNYASQTKWTIEKDIPTGILKTTNGFDSYVFKINAPSGFVTVNEIQNYDGQNSIVASLKQGTETREVEMNKGAQVARMNLIAINNTENKCTDVAFLGRIPVKNVTDVKTGEKLETNVDATMISRITENEENAVSAKIYYSTNPNADKNLSNSANGWTEEFSNVSEIKSFLIVPDGIVEAGQIFKYTYEFVIPENLPYEAKIYGSFGAFYNNHSDVAITYENTSADLVGVVTKPGPKVEAKLSVDIGDGNQVQLGKRIKYTVTVVNSGSVAVDNIKITAPIPENTVYTLLGKNTSIGDFGFSEYPDTKVLNFDINSLNPTEINEFSYYVTIKEDALSRNTKTYITNKAKVKVPLLSEEIETNEIKNEVKKANFTTTLGIEYDRDLIPGMTSNFTLNIKNISEEKLDNVKAIFNVGKIYQYESSMLDKKEFNATFDNEEGKIYFDIGTLEKGKDVTLEIKVITKKIESISENFDCKFEIVADGTEKEFSTAIPQSIKRCYLEAKDISLQIPKEIEENKELTISTQIINVGGFSCTDAKFEYEVSDALKIERVSCSNGNNFSTFSDTNIISENLPVIEPNESITVDIELIAKNNPGTDSTKATLNRAVCHSDQSDINLEQLEFTILNTEKTKEEIEKERIENLKKQEEQQRQEEQKQEEQQNENKNTENKNRNILSTQNDSQINESNNDSNDVVINDNNLEKDEKATNTNVDQEIKEQKENENSKQNQIQEENTKLSINGKAWLDENKNGRKDDEEQLVSGISVFLLKASNNIVIKSSATDNNGNYSFDSLEKGKYIIAFDFNNEKYVLTSYKKSDIEEDRNSDVISSNSEKISAITNEITLENGNADNIDIGLQNKDVFDLQIDKYISSIKVSTKKGDKTYKYNNEDLAKVEIPSKYINGAKVELVYKIIIKNTGNLAGYAEQVIDYINQDLEFDESKNKSWYKGNDGYLYTKDLNQSILQPGQTKEINLVLIKNMTEDNTGILSNKVDILKAYTQSGEKETNINNSSIQNTLISISTGKVFKSIMVIFNLIVLLCIAFGIYYQKTGKLILKIRLKKFYK